MAAMRTRPHWAGELLVVVCLLFVYDFVSAHAKVRADAAYDHGRDLLALSPGGLEKAADLWMAGVTWLHDAASYYYNLAHIDVTMAVFIACFVWRAQAYRRARTALVWVNLLGLAGFLLYPVAPPRLLPGAGFVDIVAESGTWGSWETGGGVAERANEFASMPSLHIAWAVWVALTVMTMTTRRSLQVLGWAHVLMTAVVVVVTGNHYLIDIAAGAAVTSVAWVLAPRAVLRRRAVTVSALAD
jgi:diacylglycerol O-acyltransferase